MYEIALPPNACFHVTLFCEYVRVLVQIAYRGLNLICERNTIPQSILRQIILKPTITEHAVNLVDNRQPLLQTCIFDFKTISHCLYLSRGYHVYCVILSSCNV